MTMSRPRPVALIILDGFGMRADTYGNAVAQAHKPYFDRLWETYPHTTLAASGEAVGLPEGQFGNSEVGHLNLGAGRVVYQELTRITKDIREGGFYSNPALQGAVQCVRGKGRLHLCGLLSDGGVHSHIAHLEALLELAQREQLHDVCVHAFLDGRDVLPTTGQEYAARLQQKMDELGVGRIASISGRYYAMDRDRRWERTERAYRAVVAGEGERAQDPIAAIRASYDRGVTDEFFEPTAITGADGEPVGRMRDGDAVIFFNFRPDRAIQLSRALIDPDFRDFDRGSDVVHIHYVSMTHYSDALDCPVAYPTEPLAHTFGQVLSDAGKRQLRIAETEKFPHVTSFFSGGRQVEFPGEERILIPSPKVATYDLQPEMSAPAVAQAAAQRLRSGDLDAMVLNFANPDMVGHTGVLEAAVRAVEAADAGLGVVMEALFEMGGAAVILADHGNADIMIDLATGGPCTTHTTSPVPCIVTVSQVRVRAGGVLADVAPTLLELMGLTQPEPMTGRTLLTNAKEVFEGVGDL